MMKFIVFLGVIGVALSHHCSPGEVDNSIVVYELHIDQDVEPKSYNVICAGALLDQRFVLTNRECLSRVKPDFSNIVGLKLVSQSEVLHKDQIKKVHIPASANDDIGIIEINKLEKAPNVLVSATKPWKKTPVEDLFMYQFENTNPVDGGKLENVKMERIKLDKNNVLPDGHLSAADQIGLQHLPYNHKKDLEVWGSPLLAHHAVVGVFSHSNTLADASDGDEHIFTSVDSHTNWVNEITKKNSQIRLD